MKIHFKISTEFHQYYLPCYVFVPLHCLSLFSHIFIQLNPTEPSQLPQLNFTTSTNSPVVVVQQIPRRGRRKWRGPPQQTHLPPPRQRKHPAGLGSKNSVVGQEVFCFCVFFCVFFFSFKGNGRGLTKNGTCLG